ncbi:hypothetical protein QKU48_gp1294 [Fadolivirus algeromassiliense]|jgi:hypothetical protein|uniref:Uncharacterized protein n=1 Tax=Fadolivirus FV1/VV64 TaxID=3070911 RepID=A0A7D3V622_9VIRU|nr:hypothetical protein QKU48_gp1294 [Fadolivirus algeromassiliense]QKF94752.1 hypothetical protein Fadolivirus_1_1294 [Fadolivirus FV1/VV64]
MDFLFFVCFSVVELGLLLNLYKFNIMLDCLEYFRPYKIFPWSNPGQVSSSSPLWLIAHLATALVHIFLSFVIIADRKHASTQENGYLRQWHNVSHWIFSLLILMNINHFGEADLMTAIIANGTPLAIAWIAYFSNWKYRDMIYFGAVTSPVLFEAVLRAKSWM